MGGQRNPGGPGAGRDRGSDKDKDKDKSHDSPGPIGGPSSYGMDRDTFDKTIGKDRDNGRSKEATANILDTVSDYVSEKVNDVKGWFSGVEDTGGFSPMGGPMSYGMEKKTFDTTIGEKRHKARSLSQRMVREVDYFKEAPMDYAADLIRNPLVAGAAAISGAGMTAFGITAADAVMDYMQNESTALKSISSTAASALSFTPIGESLGPLKGIAMGALESPTEGALAMGGLMGTQVGGKVSGTIAQAVTSNPLARAALTAAGTVGGAYAGKTAMQTAIDAPRSPTGMAPEAAPSDRKDMPTSPLVSSGREAVKASKKLAETSQPVDLYARTVTQLPYYGLQYQQQLPYYGV